jgi:hypothetical protein
MVEGNCNQAQNTKPNNRAESSHRFKKSSERLQTIRDLLHPTTMLMITNTIEIFCSGKWPTALNIYNAETVNGCATTRL